MFPPTSAANSALVTCGPGLELMPIQSCSFLTCSTIAVLVLLMRSMHHNFCQIPKSLRVTPAMEAGLKDHVWSLEELVALLGSRNEAAA